MKITVGRLKRIIQEALLIEASESKFYHGSSREFPVGHVLSGGHFKSEFGNQLETIFDLQRPKNMPGRKDGVFMVTRPGDVNWAGGDDAYVYEVKPMGPAFRHNQSWFAEAYGLFMKNADLKGWPPKMSKGALKSIEEPLSKFADAYWSGDKPKGSLDPWEWLARKVKIVRIVRKP